MRLRKMTSLKISLPQENGNYKRVWKTQKWPSLNKWVLIKCVSDSTPELPLLTKNKNKPNKRNNNKIWLISLFSWKMGRNQLLLKWLLQMGNCQLTLSSLVIKERNISTTDYYPSLELSIPDQFLKPWMKDFKTKFMDGLIVLELQRIWVLLLKQPLWNMKKIYIEIGLSRWRNFCDK